MSKNMIICFHLKLQWHPASYRRSHYKSTCLLKQYSQKNSEHGALCWGHCCGRTTYVIYQSRQAAFPVGGLPACRSLLCAEPLVSGAKCMKSQRKIISRQKMAVTLQLHLEKLVVFTIQLPSWPFHWSPYSKVSDRFFFLQFNLSNLITQEWVTAPLHVKAQTNTSECSQPQTYKARLGLETKCEGQRRSSRWLDILNWIAFDLGHWC